MKRRIWLLIAAIAAAVLAYYAYEVISARVSTPRIVQEIRSSGKITLSLEDVPPNRLEMFLAIEDPAFYSHHGMDFMTPGAGWTTVTQNLAKQFYFDDFHQGIMKIKQTLCAWLALDPLVDKETQLTIYLNIAYFGNGAYGFNDAAFEYFGKKASALSDEEFLALTACLIGPNELNPRDHPNENAERVRRIQKVLSGQYKPSGLLDITYQGA
jgi:membrane carboxypeptidase/penicillin-binding protein